MVIPGAFSDEEFKPITGYENYLISTKGRIWSKFSKKYLKSHLNRYGYLSITLYHKTLSVHRLVAEAFIPNPYNKPEINHLGAKTDNRVEMLERATGQENKDHAVANNLTAKGIKNGRAKLNDNDIVEIRHLLSLGYSQTKLAKMFNISRRLIFFIKNKNIWKHI